MSRLHRVSPASLKGDDGWRLRDTYSDLIKDIERFESVFFINIECLPKYLPLQVSTPSSIHRYA